MGDADGSGAVDPLREARQPGWITVAGLLRNSHVETIVSYEGRDVQPLLADDETFSGRFVPGVP
jgi:hypothetical protein